MQLKKRRNYAASFAIYFYKLTLGCNCNNSDTVILLCPLLFRLRLQLRCPLTEYPASDS